MKDMLEALVGGMGASLSAFGTFPAYDVPKRGDSSKDFRKVGLDIFIVTDRIEEKSTYCLSGNDESSNYSSGEK